MSTKTVKREMYALKRSLGDCYVSGISTTKDPATGRTRPFYCLSLEDAVLLSKFRAEEIKNRFPFENLRAVPIKETIVTFREINHKLP